MWTHRGIKVLLAAGYITNTFVSGISSAEDKQNILSLNSQDGGTPAPQIITGAYGVANQAPEIRIYSESGTLHWSWDAKHDGGNISDSLRKCMAGRAVTDFKWSKDRTRIAAIVGATAIVVQHTPWNATTDKLLLFGRCEEHQNTHTLEFLPDNLLAVATSGGSLDDGIWIYNISHVNATPKSVQNITHIPAVHGIVWDERDRILWAAGNNANPAGSVSTSIVEGYRYNCACKEFWPLQEAFARYQVSDIQPLATEWRGSAYAKWWDGSHDMVPIPGERKLLITTDLDVHLFDLTTKTFTHGAEVADKYLPGFQPIDKRQGLSIKNLWEDLPRSDIKGVSFASGGRMVYTQAKWQDTDALCSQVNIVVNGKHLPPIVHGRPLYRARWFVSTNGWPSAM